MRLANVSRVLNLLTLYLFLDADIRAKFSRHCRTAEAARRRSPGAVSPVVR